VLLVANKDGFVCLEDDDMPATLEVVVEFLDRDTIIIDVRVSLEGTRTFL
jgi:hypothetical protein